MDTNQHCCPNCAGQQIALKKMLYYQGTSDHSGSYSGSFGGYISGGHWMGGTQGGGYSGINQTRLASLLSPPRRKSTSLIRVNSILGRIIYGWCYLGIIILVGKISPIISFVVAGIGVFKYLNASRYNTTVYPKLYRQWEKEWFCLSCGSAWTYE